MTTFRHVPVTGTGGGGLHFSLLHWYYQSSFRTAAGPQTGWKGSLGVLLHLLYCTLNVCTCGNYSLAEISRTNARFWW